MQSQPAMDAIHTERRKTMDSMDSMDSILQLPFFDYKVTHSSIVFIGQQYNTIASSSDSSSNGS